MESPNLFSVPRRFDLASVLVVTSAYAVLFAGMRLLNFSWLVFGSIAALLTFVAICQPLFWGGTKPREASGLAGFIFWGVWLIAVALPSERRFTMLCVGLFLSVSGGLSGYLAGVMVAGVFLVAHYLRGWIGLLRRRKVEEDRQSPWDD